MYLNIIAGKKRECNANRARKKCVCIWKINRWETLNALMAKHKK